MRFADFPFLRYLPFLIAGIVLATYFPIQIWPVPFAEILVGWIIYAWGVGKSQPVQTGFSAALGYSLLFFLGYSLTIREAVNQISPRFEEDSFQAYMAEVQRYDLEKPNSRENLLELVAVRDSMGWRHAAGKILIYHKSDLGLQPGDLIWVNKKPEEIPAPVFPNEFDYKGFLAKKGIYYRQFIGNDFVKLDSSAGQNIAYAIPRLREGFAQLIQSKIQHSESKQIALALLLGQKESLDREIRNAYSETGTMHILAVSGLHVGIIYAILLLPLRGFRASAKIRSFYLVLVILIVWIYALMTGFSPSVVRASVMFSLFTAGQMRKRKPSIWNILAFSAMIMLVLDPDVLFEVGFQLSYLAVAGIVGLQPLIVRWWLPPNRILEYFWQLAAVSIAAQLATFPLSVFYFHQFPTYFLFANLIVVPLAFLIMSVGVPFLLLGWVPGLGDGLAWLVDAMIFVQHRITLLIQLLPMGKIDRLTITFSGMVLVWISLLIWGNWEMGNRKKLVALGLFFGGIWLGEGIIRELMRPSNQLLFFSSEKGTLIDLQLGNRHFSWNQDFLPDQISFSIDPNRLQEHRLASPLSLKAIPQDSTFFFPGLDFRYFPKEKYIRWEGQKPEKIQEFRREISGANCREDSILQQSLGFRAIF